MTAARPGPAIRPLRPSEVGAAKSFDALVADWRGYWAYAKGRRRREKNNSAVKRQLTTIRNFENIQIISLSGYSAVAPTPSREQKHENTCSDFLDRVFDWHSFRLLFNTSSSAAG
jgi:hypothetical protein